MSAMMMMAIDGDRRAHPRHVLQRPCKVFDPHGRRYQSASTCDISAGGALIDLPRLTNLRPGDKVYVGIALKRRDEFLRADEMLEAQVVRALPTMDDHTALAVQFAVPQETQALAVEPLRIAA